MVGATIMVLVSGAFARLWVAAPAFAQLATVQPAPRPGGLGRAGLFVAPAGAPLLSFCSVNGCFPGDHLRAQVLVNSTTLSDASTQEVGLFVNMTSRTGKTAIWTPNTRYVQGAEVSSNGVLYQALVGGVSERVPPSGARDRIGDGTVIWSFRSTVVHDGKTALGAGLDMVPGSGQGWSLVSDLTVQPGVGDENAFGYENDCANYNKDSFFGVHFLMTCFFQGGQGAGTYPMFAYRYVAAGDGSSFGAHFGDFFNGKNTIKDATIADATNARSTLVVMPGSVHDTVLLDQSTSTRSIQLTGKYTVGIDISAASFIQGQIAGRYWGVSPNGIVTAAGFVAPLKPPRSSSDACMPGESRNGPDFIYVCVAANKWKRAALNSW